MIVELLTAITKTGYRKQYEDKPRKIILCNGEHTTGFSVKYSAGSSRYYYIDRYGKQQSILSNLVKEIK
jgi:hypothetical protein